ncbi:hypothetical protein GCM10025877_05260 [Agromyces mangrovi Wang et al. 2018]|nr:hypothetical protein GCM10025877_05260 [Agromyces mangrovi]
MIPEALHAMPDSPLQATPYEVLGVRPDASTGELRSAYRRKLRETHPDTGGDPDRFHEVQAAWERVGTAEARAAYDRGGPARTTTADDGAGSWSMPRTQGERRDTRPGTRSHGHPGGVSRVRYLELIREWAGRGVDLPDPFGADLVRRAPREIRHVLADALAEEATARTVSTLGIAYTAWHDVATDAAGPGLPAKLDHVVLGPTGLFALQSEDWGAPVRIRRGELIGEALAGEKPMRALAQRAKAVGRAAHVKFTCLLVVVPDGDSDEDLQVLGSTRGAVTALVQRSRLAGVLRTGLPGSALIGGGEVMEVRTRLQQSIRFA